MAEAAAAPKVSAVAAKLAWEAESGLFVDLRTVGSISIEGFERIPSAQLMQSLKKLEDAAVEANTKDIYFLDSSGYLSAQAVLSLKAAPQFSGYNARAIEGGLGEWIADNGPFSVSNAAADDLLSKLRSEANNETRNEQFLQQFTSELGISPKPTDMLELDTETGAVKEVPLDLSPERLIDQAAFRKFTQKLKL